MKNAKIKKLVAKLQELDLPLGYKGIHATTKTVELGLEEFEYLSVGLSNEDNGLFADYYEFGYPWICDELEAFAKKAGCYWDWYNPEEIYLVEA